MKRWIKKIFLTGFWGGLVLVWIVVGLFYYQGSHPVSQDIQARVFEVQPGMSLKQVAQELSLKGLIRSPSVFQAIAYIQSKQTQIMIGEYPCFHPKFFSALRLGKPFCTLSPFQRVTE
jgi:cell division protein YceG involved in septum cleavage